MYAILDTETGGLDPVRNALCSIAIVIYDDQLQEIERHYTLVKDKPEKIIEDQALAVNKLTREEINEKGRDIDYVINRTKELIEGKILVAHNGAFDFAFLNNRGLNVLSCIDTMDISWKKWPNKKAKLGMVVERMGIEIENSHNSLGDALMTGKILKEFSKEENLHALEPKPIIFDRF